MVRSGSRGTATAGRGTGEEPVRQRLLAAATRLFAEQGFESTSVQQIVAAAGVTKGAMYHYFDSKDDLLHEIYTRVLRLQTERLHRIADGTGPVEQRLRAAAVDAIVTTLEHFDDATVFWRSMHLLSHGVQQTVRAERRRYHERFRDLIAEGQRTGVFSDRTPAELVVDFFFGAVHHLSTWYRPGGPPAGPQLAAHFADLLLAALRPDH